MDCRARLLRLAELPAEPPLVQRLTRPRVSRRLRAWARLATRSQRRAQLLATRPGRRPQTLATRGAPAPARWGRLRALHRMPWPALPGEETPSLTRALRGRAPQSAGARGRGIAAPGVTAAPAHGPAPAIGVLRDRAPQGAGTGPLGVPSAHRGNLPGDSAAIGALRTSEHARGATHPQLAPVIGALHTALPSRPAGAATPLVALRGAAPQGETTDGHGATIGVLRTSLPQGAPTDAAPSAPGAVHPRATSSPAASGAARLAAHPKDAPRRAATRAPGAAAALRTAVPLRAPHDAAPADAPRVGALRDLAPHHAAPGTPGVTPSAPALRTAVVPHRAPDGTALRDASTAAPFRPAAGPRAPASAPGVVGALGGTVPRGATPSERRAAPALGSLPPARQPLARAAGNAAFPRLAPAAAELALEPSIGAPLDGPLRARMEHRLGADLGGVRIHADEAAGRVTRALGAAAFALGRHVFVAPARFAPDTVPGEALLAHELVHVAQQPAGRAFAADELTPGRRSLLEGEAWTAAGFPDASSTAAPRVHAPLALAAASPRSGLTPLLAEDAAVPPPSSSVVAGAATQPAAPPPADAASLAGEVLRLLTHHDRIEHERRGVDRWR